ncbi:MAG: hypothetical protein CMB80_04630 [Flammeovirgaceae bacterium]|nr:hypothetical protein [Flammeovirgaceae bacterium]MBE61852.1 hypothetical protein [Flammeovirgaceae bacterium]|tara:strand:+ start:1971 stop:2171 length:201 start_codon:yes stop_codon:yes gene_type:complete
MSGNNIHGVIWFDGEFQSGLIEDFEVYSTQHKDSRIVMNYYASSRQELANIAKTLNNSNLRSIERG